MLFGLGFVLYIDRESQLYGQLFHLLPSSGPLIALDKIPAVLAGAGTTILLLSFLGCYGACVESVCFLWLVSQSVFTEKLRTASIRNNNNNNNKLCAWRHNMPSPSPPPVGAQTPRIAFWFGLEPPIAVYLTSVFCTTMGVCEILSRSVQIWQYEGQEPVLE